MPSYGLLLTHVGAVQGPAVTRSRQDFQRSKTYGARPQRRAATAGDRGGASQGWPAIEPHHDVIKGLLGQVTVSTVHQGLSDEHGLAVSLSSLRRYVAANLPAEAAASGVTVLRDDPPPGSEAQVDYGMLGSWTDPVRGVRRRVWAFVLVLAASRHMFVRPVLSMDQQAWNAAHVAAFEFFDSVPARIVPDNLKTGVAKPDLYDPKINRAYAELGAHYGVLIDPARAGKPKDKPRVERPMPYVRDSFWRGREFSSLEQMQAEAVRWCSEVAGRRACRPLGGAAPAAVFAAPEAGALAPLPVRAFELASWSRPKVGPDIHIKVGKTLYSVPWTLIGQHVDVRATSAAVQVCCDGRLVKTHVAAPGRVGSPTTPTTRRRRSSSTWVPPPGAATGPPGSARTRSRSAASCSRSTRCSGCAQHRACSAWPTSTALSGWRRPARTRSRSAIRPTARSRGSCRSAPTVSRLRPARPGTVAPQRTCAVRPPSRWSSRTACSSTRPPARC